MKNSRLFAFIAYLLFVPGWLVVFLFRRKDEFSRYHAQQSFALNLIALLSICVWFVITWLVIAIPIAGPMFAWFLFAIIIAEAIWLLVIWMTGMAYVIRSEMSPLPLVGGWASKLPF